MNTVSDFVITMSHEELNKFLPHPLLMGTEYVIGTEGFYIKILCKLMDDEAGSNLAEYILDKTACARHTHMHKEIFGGDPVSANSQGWLLASNLADDRELKGEDEIKETAIALGRCWLRAVHEELHAPKK